MRVSATEQLLFHNNILKGKGMDKKLTEKVNLNEHGFYEIKSEYRKVMKSFYEVEYYQDNHAIYQKEEYSQEDLRYRDNVYTQKIAALEKWGVSGRAKKHTRYRVRRRICFIVFREKWMASMRH